MAARFIITQTANVEGADAKVFAGWSLFGKPMWSSRTYITTLVLFEDSSTANSQLTIIKTDATEFDDHTYALLQIEISGF